MSRRLATLQVDVAAEHVDPDGVADADAPAFGQAGIERHQRRRRCSRRGHHWPGDDACARRRRGGVGQAAIAAQRPGGVGRRLDLVGRHAVHRDDAGAQAGHLAAGPARPGWPWTSASKRGNWLSWMSTKKKLGALAGHLFAGSPAARCPGSVRRRPGWTGRARPRPASAASRCRAGAGWRGRAGRRRRRRARPARAASITSAPPSRNSASVTSGGGAEPQGETRDRRR